MILKIILIVAAMIIAALLGFAASKPNIFQIQRSIQIKAPPEKIFPFINDFHNWGSWAPQDKDDPTMVRTYSGAASGTGAVSEWKSTGTAGNGRMTIVESVPASRIAVKVDFIKPFAAHNLNEFRFEPDGEFTRVTWSMHGTNLYIMKLMSVFVNMNSIVGKHFEDGLKNLKAAAER
ncbi:MAG TPA: SRPBCC family protein [Candidatus Sulfotelmatobacter sp.]